MNGERSAVNIKEKILTVKASVFNYDSFMGLGFESIFIALIAGIFFGFLVGLYPAFTLLFPFLPSTNLLLFIAYGVPLTGSSHYDPRLGMLSGTVILITARAAQLLFGLAPNSQEFLMLAGLWSVTQIFLIGYLPGRLIPTSESLGLLFKGIAKIAVLYAGAEYLFWGLSIGLELPASILLVYPGYSIPLLLIVSTLTAFAFTNTFCPYMMMPLVSNAIKRGGHRQCGSWNYVFKLEKTVKIDKSTLKQAQKKGFRVISELPSVTVFSCPRGGVISVYHNGDMLIRKVNKGTAERISRHLAPIVSR